MRNLFDQYMHPENRLTHALMTSLNEDRALLGKFIKWATDYSAPCAPQGLKVIEQALPGEEEQQDVEELASKGLPDGCIHDGNGWALLIESKIKAHLDLGQLKRHRHSAIIHEQTNVYLLALVVTKSKHPHLEDVIVRQWTELYEWLKNKNPDSYWAKQLIAYLEALEAKLLNEGYLNEGALTVFTGVPFKKDNPYSYFEAKRLIKLAMEELRARHDLQRDLGTNGDRPGRTAITGRGSPHVWDFLWLADAKETESFTEFPHPGLGIHREYLNALLIVPNGIRAEFRRNLLDGGVDGFHALFKSVLAGFSELLGSVEGAIPWVEIVQRRYPSQRSEPFVDAKLEFDLRTGFDPSYRWEKSAKKQTEWIDATYLALSNRSSNLQLAVGAKFPYEQCPIVNSREILNCIANAWLSCLPLKQKMIP